jgi:acyl-coenzyme A thioesterase PaaI-like protein
MADKQVIPGEAMRWAFKPQIMRKLLNFWPPFFFSGIKVAVLAEDYRYARVELKNRLWTRNINNSQFGGSMFAMTDPIFPLLLMGALGKEYIVWDKQADIDYIKPGLGTLSAEFILTDEMVADITAHTASGAKYFPQFLVHVKDQDNNIVCEVNRTVYIRKKPQYR